MRNAQYIDETPGQLINKLICKEVEITPFATINDGVIKSGVSLKLIGYNLEGILTGLMEEHDVKKLLKEMMMLLTESEEKDEVIKQIKELLK